MLCTVYRILCTMYCVPCTVYLVLCTLYCVQCMVYCVCVQFTVYLCTAYCVQFTVHGKLFTLVEWFTVAVYRTTYMIQAEPLFSESIVLPLRCRI